MLDLSRIEAGRLTIEATSTDLDQLTLDLEYVLADAARRKGLKLTMAIAPDIPRRVVLDGRHLRQVLLNLLGNAIKFTSHGEVRLGIARGDDGRLTFEVVDTGIGIEPEALDMIFEAFTQTRAGASAGSAAPIPKAVNKIAAPAATARLLFNGPMRVEASLGNLGTTPAV